MVLWHALSRRISCSSTGWHQLGTNAPYTLLLFCKHRMKDCFTGGTLSLGLPRKCGLDLKVAMALSFEPRNNVQKNSALLFLFSFSFPPPQFVAEALRWSETPRHLHNGAINCDPVPTDWEEWILNMLFKQKVQQTRMSLSNRSLNSAPRDWGPTTTLHFNLARVLHWRFAFLKQGTHILYTTLLSIERTPSKDWISRRLNKTSAFVAGSSVSLFSFPFSSHAEQKNSLKSTFNT